MFERISVSRLLLTPLRKYTYELAFMVYRVACNWKVHIIVAIISSVHGRLRIYVFWVPEEETRRILSEMWHSVSPPVRTSTAARPLQCLETVGAHRPPSLTHSWLTTGTLTLLKVSFDMKHTWYIWEQQEASRTWSWRPHDWFSLKSHDAPPSWRSFSLNPPSPSISPS